MTIDYVSIGIWCNKMTLQDDKIACDQRDYSSLHVKLIFLLVQDFSTDYFDNSTSLPRNNEIGSSGPL